MPMMLYYHVCIHTGRAEFHLSYTAQLIYGKVALLPPNSQYDGNMNSTLHVQLDL